MGDPAVTVGLTAVIVAVTADRPRILTVGGEPARAGETDSPRSSGDENDPPVSVRRGHASCSRASVDQRTTALAAVIPAPNPTKRTRSPSDTLPSSSASASASGIEADDVLPVR